MTTETYKGYTIAIKQDEFNSQNPLTDWDHCGLVVTLYDGRFTTYYNTDKRDNHKPDAPELTKAQAKELIPDLMQEEGYTSLKQWLTDNYYSPVNWSSITDWLNDEYIPDYLTDDDIDRIDQVFKAAGMQTYNGSTQGYCQGDYAEVLVIADEDYYKLSGNNPNQDQTENLEGIKDVYGAWVWGDVYGYVITKPNECPSCHHDEPEVIDSCWGYYGDDHEKSGLLPQARHVIDHQ